MASKSSFVAKTIVFEDHGQDFLEWDLTVDGGVIGCRPFQASVWVGCRVVNFNVEVGDCVIYLSPNDGRERSIGYPVVEVR
jgi:hypothetical protein